MSSSSSNSSHLPLLLVLLFLVPLCSTTRAGSIVGGRTKVKDVKANKEVQELGRFCVQEYNRMQRSGNGSGSGSGKLLMFSEVVEAETQVVSGIKYYLRIAAAGGAAARMFDAVVVVKPWQSSKELINFAPSSKYLADATK